MGHYITVEGRRFLRAELEVILGMNRDAKCLGFSVSGNSVVIQGKTFSREEIGKVLKADKAKAKRKVAKSKVEDTYIPVTEPS